MNLRQPFLRKSLAHIKSLGGQTFTARFEATIDLARIYVAVVRSIEDEPKAIAKLAHATLPVRDIGH
ncbi:Uncharacterised protein [Collinsella intestinalis]|nr:Uncharacterised protein [Collinsella intestinalis]